MLMSPSYTRTRSRFEQWRRHNGRRYVTVLPALISGASSTSRFRCRVLLDTGSPQSFIPLGAFDQMVAIGTAYKSYVRSTTPRYRRVVTALKSYSAQTDRSEQSFNFTTTVRFPRRVRNGYTSFPIRKCKTPCFLAAIDGYDSTRGPTKRSRPNAMAAFSVNSPFRTFMTTLTTVLYSQLWGPACCLPP